MQRLTVLAAIIGVSTSARAEVTKPREGAVCFGKKGPTAMGALMPTIIDILENGATTTRIGRCRLVSNGIELTSHAELTVWDGKQRVAVLGVCGGEILARGIAVEDERVRVGDRASRLAGDPQLACKRVPGRKAISCAHEDGVYDPYVWYEVSLGSTPPEGELRGDELVTLLAKGRITSIGRNWGCG